MRYRLEIKEEARQQLRALEKDLISVYAVRYRKQAYE